MDPDLEDVLRSAWGGMTPYLMPLLILAVLCVLRVRVAEIFAEMYFVFVRRFQILGGAPESGRASVAGGAFREERLERFWDALCNWRDAYRDAVGLTTDSLGKVHIANGLLILNIEKTLPFLPAELRALAEEISRDCIRERQIWQTAAEKREPFLKDAATAYAKIDRQIQHDLFPKLEALLSPADSTNSEK